MASGDPSIQILEVMPPDANFAQLIRRAGGSTPGENVRVYAFDAATAEYTDYLCRLHGYGDGGLTLRLFWMAATATSGVTRWGAAIRRLGDDIEDVDASHTYTFNTVNATAASVSGEVDYTTITFSHGADMDLWADGELAIVRIQRDAGNGADTMAGDAQLLTWTGEET